MDLFFPGNIIYSLKLADFFIYGSVADLSARGVLPPVPPAPPLHGPKLS